MSDRISIAFSSGIIVGAVVAGLSMLAVLFYI